MRTFMHTHMTHTHMHESLQRRNTQPYWMVTKIHHACRWKSYISHGHIYTQSIYVASVEHRLLFIFKQSCVCTRVCVLLCSLRGLRMSRVQNVWYVCVHEQYKPFMSGFGHTFIIHLAIKGMCFFCFLSFCLSPGRAYLFKKVVNLTYTHIQDRVMLTGRHMVRDVMCKYCKSKLGWMYEYATEDSQK